jgi:hypothetical protein
MKLRFFGKVIGFLTLLVNALLGVTDLIGPVLQVVQGVKAMIEGAKNAKRTVNGLVSTLPKALQAKLNSALPNAIQKLGLNIDAKLTPDEQLAALVEYVNKQPNEVRSSIYAKLSSLLFRELEPKVSEAEADTAIQLAYFQSKVKSGVVEVVDHQAEPEAVAAATPVE